MAAKSIVDSPRSHEAEGPGLGVSAGRISERGVLTQPVGGEALKARWLGTKKVVQGVDGRFDWPKLRIGSTVYYVGDFIYVTPDEQGEPMDTAQLLKLFDTGQGSQSNRKQMLVRWFWRPLQLLGEHDNMTTDDVEEFEFNECFYTDTTDEMSTDCIEG
jgi:hypothetical protein